MTSQFVLNKASWSVAEVIIRSFVLSATFQSKLCGTISAVKKNIGAVLELAPLSLRKVPCHQISVCTLTSNFTRPAELAREYGRYVMQRQAPYL